MTRARALKQVIRARAAKTGERYTTARRHVLKGLASTPGSHRQGETEESGQPRRAPGLVGKATGVSAPAIAPTKGSVTDEKSREKTGHGLDHWFAVLDRFGGVDKGHSALARHLYDDHHVNGWYSQGITVAYERARGARALNQRMSGDYEVSVTKTVNGDTATVVRAFTDAKRRAKWLLAVDAELGAALIAALKAKSSKGFVIRPDGMGRFRYKWGTTPVQFYAIPKGEGRTSVVVTQMKLADAAAVETSRGQWRGALAALAQVLQ
jgi:hypothetical protein